jgi:hypothetical protein
VALLTPEEMEKGLLRLEASVLHHDAKIADLTGKMATLAETMDRFARLEGERHGEINAALKLLAESHHSLAESHQALADQQRLTNAALDRLTELIDRFLRGRSGNGDQP